MLKQRIITALLLLAVLLPAVFYPVAEVFALVAVVLIAAGAWEWARMNQCGQAGSLVAGALCALMCLLSWYAGLLYAPLKALWILAGGAWVILGAWLLYRGVPVWMQVPRVLRLSGGVLALWVAWVAVAQARIMGINFLFSVLVLVWVADIFAYFAGRALGGRFFARKLAPSISPGKTWEGALGGMAGVVACSFLWRSLGHCASGGDTRPCTRLGSWHGGLRAGARAVLRRCRLPGPGRCHGCGRAPSCPPGFRIAWLCTFTPASARAMDPWKRICSRLSSSCVAIGWTYCICIWSTFCPA